MGNPTPRIPFFISLWVYRYVYLNNCFVHLIFGFGHFWRQSYENTKILRNLWLDFARQDGQDRKNGRKIMQLKTKIPKDDNMG